MKSTRQCKNRLRKISPYATCVKCKSEFLLTDISIHHVIPSRWIRRLSPMVEQPLSFLQNQRLVPLCRNCHDEVEEYNKGLERKYGLNKRFAKAISAQDPIDVCNTPKNLYVNIVSIFPSKFNELVSV